MKLRLLLAFLFLPAVAQALPTVSFERVARSFVDPVPGGQPGEMFFNLGTPALSGFDVAFGASGTMGTQGLYCYCGGVMQKIAASGDPTPQGDGAFFFFEFAPGLYRGEAVFSAATQNSLLFYRWHEGTLSVVVDSTVPIPGGEPGETFPRFLGRQASIDENGVVFFADGETTKGIYRQREAGGPIEVVVDIHTENPWVPGEMFHALTDWPYSRNGSTVFSAGSPSWGGFVRDSGAGWVPSFVGGPLPGGLPGETFGGVEGSRLSADFESIVFAARGNIGTFGWYREGGGTLEVGVDTHTINPVTGVAFQNIASTVSAVDSNRLAFKSGFVTQSTLFLREPTGVFVPIVTEGEELEGEFISFLHIDRSSLSGNRLGFSVFSTAREAVYVATVGRGGPSVLEIPTLDWGALATLMLLLGVAGLSVLRRAT